VTVGKPASRVTLFDAGVFFQDDWRLRFNLTFSYGIRYEGQTGSTITPTLVRSFRSPGALGYWRYSREDRLPRRIWLVLRPLPGEKRATGNTPKRH
jgi:hypothetical protein